MCAHLIITPIHCLSLNFCYTIVQSACTNAFFSALSLTHSLAPFTYSCFLFSQSFPLTLKFVLAKFGTLCCHCALWVLGRSVRVTVTHCPVCTMSWPVLPQGPVFGCCLDISNHDQGSWVDCVCVCVCVDLFSICASVADIFSLFILTSALKPKPKWN